MEISMKELKDIILGNTTLQKTLLEDNSGGIWDIGSNYLIRTVTMTIAGKLIEVTDKELLLHAASWIADTGRFSENLISCEFNEVEMFNNPVIVGRGAIVDATIISKLPTVTK